LALGVCEQRDPLGGGPKLDPLPGQAGAESERDRQDASMAVKFRSLRNSRRTLGNESLEAL
jgi:hypothetical protein